MSQTGAPTMPAQYGPHRWSAGYHDDGRNHEFRGAQFLVKDLRDATFVDCDMAGVRIRDANLTDVQVSGWVDGLVVNGVDVTAYVDAELDRRHPERVQLRQIASADDFRAMWETLEQRWGDVIVRAERLPEAALHEQVDGEWSFVQTLRHLVFITDSWIRSTVLDEDRPFHRLGLPQTAYSPAHARALGMELDAEPSYAEVLAARADRMRIVRDLLAGLENSGLGRMSNRPPAPGYPQESRAVGECLGVLMDEEVEHLRFAMRDLAVLEARHGFA